MLVLAWVLPCQAAGSVKWQLNWMENGDLREEVRIPTEIIEAPTDKAWSHTQEGDDWVFQRDIKGWANYQSHKDGLPFLINENKNILYSLTEIKTDPQSNQDWFEKIAGTNELELTIEVPGLILSSTADQRNDLISSWTFPRGTDLGSEGVILKVVRIDGLVMGIGMVAIGLFLAVFIFYRRVKSAEAIIAENYAIPPRDQSDQKEPK